MGEFNSATIIALVIFTLALVFSIRHTKKGFKGCDGCTSNDCANCSKVNDLQRMYVEGKKREKEELERLGLEEELQKEMNKNK